MALFKIFKGVRENLPVKMTEGYAYFTTDEGMLYIDISDSQRVQVNALYATGLKDAEGTEIAADEVLTTSDVIQVENGGTGMESLTANGILVGQGTDPVKLIVIPDGEFVVGSTTDGLSSLDAAGVRDKLNVYDKDMVDSKVTGATTVAYTTKLLKGEAWNKSGDFYTQKYNQPSLKCGVGGNVPPLVTYTSNKEEYSKIDHADATAKDGITFYTKEQPANDIDIIVIDQA